MKEKWKEWLCIVLTSILLPCILTLLISGTSENAGDKKSGATIEFEDGEKMDMDEFLIYMTAGQIGLDSEEETLKAQAVIARTNLVRQLNGAKNAEIKDLNLVYLSPEKFDNSFGEAKRDKVRKQLKKIVNETDSMVMTYDGEYIEALYHGVSIGSTVSAEEIYGQARPYLVAVDSSQDVEAEDYMTLSIYSPMEVLSKLNEKGKAKTQTSDTIFSALKVEDKTKSGYVKCVAVGQDKVTGEEWKEMFHLNSSNFYLEERDGQLRMITLGKGHGVGMSQYGADYLAKQGWSWEKILKKYYPGISIVSYE